MTKHEGVEASLGAGRERAEEEVHRNGDGSGEGHFVDENGSKVEGLIRFRVTKVETSRSADRENGFISIEGTMIDEEEEQRQGPKTVGSREKALKSSTQPGGHDYYMSGGLVSGSEDGTMDGIMEINGTDNSKNVNY